MRAAFPAALAVSNATLPNFNPKEPRAEPKYDWPVPYTPCSWDVSHIHMQLLPMPVLLLLLLLLPPWLLSGCCFA
jgi:hypothetical protein